MRLLALLAAGLLVGPLLADDKKDEKIDAAKLVGKWKATKFRGEASKQTVTFEFTKDGEAKMRFEDGPSIFQMVGAYTVSGSTITLKFKGRENQKDTTEIVKLDDGVLHLKEMGEKANVNEFERVKEEKKEEKKDK